MPGTRTAITEIVTGLGTLSRDLDEALASRPDQLVNVPASVWNAIVAARSEAGNAQFFDSAFANGSAFLKSMDGLRERAPLIVEWKGPNRPPGDDVVPADLRIDHVFQISCKYLSKILQNCGPARLFERNLVGEQRTKEDWFFAVAPDEYQLFYEGIRQWFAPQLPPDVSALRAEDRSVLKDRLRVRVLPPPLRPRWEELCATVSLASAERWNANLVDKRARLRTLWRLLRIGDAPYFILGAVGASQLRLRVASAWDWTQQYGLDAFTVNPRESGQPEVNWRADVTERSTGRRMVVEGHVEIRWSHGRFQGSPEAKVYLDTAHAGVPGFFPLV